MPSEMSFPGPVGVLFDLARMAVRDWATVSAMPPRICRVTMLQLMFKLFGEVWGDGFIIRNL